jgi:hypothetical protein
LVATLDADISITLYRALIGARGIPSERRGGMALHCVLQINAFLRAQSHAHRSRAIVVLRLPGKPFDASSLVPSAARGPSTRGTWSAGRWEAGFDESQIRFVFEIVDCALIFVRPAAVT